MKKKRTSSPFPGFGSRNAVQDYYKRTGLTPNFEAQAFLDGNDITGRKKTGKTALASSQKPSPHEKALEALRNKPELLQKYGLEHWEQVRYLRKLELELPEVYQFTYGVPNAGSRGYQSRSTMLAEGLRSGVFDISVDLPRGPYPFLRIEFKSPKIAYRDGRQKDGMSDNQKEWAKIYELAGALATQCNNHVTAFEITKRYYDLGPLDPSSPPLEPSLLFQPWKPMM